MKKSIFVLLFALMGMSQTSQAQEGFIGEIRMFAGNFVPRGWAYCDGKLLPINQYQAVYSILGTTYGGNGQTTFGLPDLRGRVPVQPGQGPGLPNYTLGEMGGAETITLLQSQLPFMQSSMMATDQAADSNDPTNAVLAVPAGETKIYRKESPTPNIMMNPGSTRPVGGSQPVNNMQPYLGVNYIICLEGIFPSRG